MGLNAQQCVYLVLAFATGFAVNRYMNHQDIITGDVKEGMTTEDTLIFVGMLVAVAIAWFLTGCSWCQSRRR